MDQTQRLLIKLNSIDPEADITEDQIIDFLNRSESFMSFSEALTRVVKEKQKDPSISPAEYLRACFEEEHIPYNRNTIRNWFDGKGPKKGTGAREKMYQICFALRLSADETAEFFRKVFMDRPFDVRSKEEFIYFYCLNNRYSYRHACNLISIAGQSSGREMDQTVETMLIRKDAERFEADQDILDYIHAHEHNFRISNKSAKRTLTMLLSQVMPDDDDIELIKRGDGKNAASIIGREIQRSVQPEDYKNKSYKSISFMLEIIYGIDMVKERNASGGSLFKNARLPQEIKNRFPAKQTFSKSDPTYEEYRKMIILLYSYKFWFRKQWKEYPAGMDYEPELEDYIEDLNDVLTNASLQELYVGNPFDWMFMYCTINEFPLDTFRDLMAEVLLQDEEDW